MKLVSLLSIPILAVLGRIVHADLPSTIEPAASAACLRSSHGLQARPDGTWVAGGADYRARFDGTGFVYEPALGAAVDRTQHLSLRFVALERGASPISIAPTTAVRAVDRTLIYDHGAIDERFAARADGVELSYVFDEPLAGEGDLVVRLELDTSLALAHADASSGLRFERPEGGVAIGGVTGIDAHGRRVSGSIAMQGTELVLRLPGAFVDAATYPLVLDPLVGTSFGVSTGSFEDANPDAAYDATNAVYLVTWQRTFSASNVEIRGQRVSAAGALVGSTLFLTSSAIARDARVANLNSEDRWMVVWSRLTPNESALELAFVDAATGSVLAPFPILSYGSGSEMLLVEPHFCSLGTSTPSSGSEDVLLVYEDEFRNEIQMKHLTVNGLSIAFGPAVVVFTDVPPFTSYSKLSVPKCAGAAGRTLIACARSGIGASAIQGRVVDLLGNTYGTVVTLSQSSLTGLTSPDVDGFDGQFVTAWEGTNASGDRRVQLAASSLNASQTQVVAKPTVDLSPGAVIGDFDRPSVAYSRGKSWVAYRQSGATAGSLARIKGFDSASCIACEGPLTLASSSADVDARVVVAATTSGGSVNSDKGLAIWSLQGSGSSSDISAQLLANNAQSGTVQNIGGGCGTGGAISFSAAPSIGTSQLQATLQGVGGGATLSIVNFAFGAPAGITCGSCAWAPFQITQTLSSAGGTAKAAITIPCDPQLLGASLDVQFTSLTPTSSACLLFAGLSLSDRWRMTIGQ